MRHKPVFHISSCNHQHFPAPFVRSKRSSKRLVGRGRLRGARGRRPRPRAAQGAGIGRTAGDGGLAASCASSRHPPEIYIGATPRLRLLWRRAARLKWLIVALASATSEQCALRRDPRQARGQERPTCDRGELAGCRAWAAELEDDACGPDRTHTSHWRAAGTRRTRRGDAIASRLPVPAQSCRTGRRSHAASAGNGGSSAWDLLATQQPWLGHTNSSEEDVEAVAADAPTTAADPTQEPAAAPRRGKKPRKPTRAGRGRTAGFLPGLQGM